MSTSWTDHTSTSQSQPPLLSLPAELLELVVLHFATSPPTQPSANTTLGTESHAQSSFPSTEECPLCIYRPLLLVLSIPIEGSQVLSVSFQPSNRSVLSTRFLDSLPVNSRTNPLLVTTVVGQHHPISFPLSYETSNLNPTDLVLGLDWAAFFLRDSLLGLGIPEPFCQE
ncbi:hypothetical protein B0H13DRAFT_2339464 [Mycena leptocephala]|nr:hypothetical protein B0H13DRAFT_2339464 [Mycena leptocephala]